MYQDPDSGRWVIIGWLEFHFIKKHRIAQYCIAMRMLSGVTLYCQDTMTVNSEECRLSEMYSWTGFSDINVSVHYQLYVKSHLSKL